MRAALLVAVALLTGCSGTSAPNSAQKPGAVQRPGAVQTTYALHASASPHTGSATASRVPQIRVGTAMRLPSGVSRAVAVADGTQLLVLGGLAAGDSTTGRVWSVDLANRRARVVGSLATPVHDACGALVAGHPFVFGGGAATTQNVVQQWQSASSRQVAALPQPRSDSSCAQLGATAYIAGGFDGHRMLTAVLATSDGRHFRVVAHLRQGVRYAAVAAVGQWVLVIGGALATTEGTSTGGQSDLIQRVDVHTGRVDVIGHLPQSLAHATGVTVAGHVLVVGGRRGATATADISTVDAGSGAVHLLGRLPQALSDAAVAVAGGTAVVVGGETTGPSAPVSTVTALRLLP